MKRIVTLMLVLLLPATYMAMAEDNRASRKEKRAKSAKAPPVAAAPFAIAVPVKTGLRLPSLFGDHMILQQKTKNAIWGWANPKERVTVEASWGASVSAQSDADGRWKVLLDTPAYGTGFSLKITGSKTIEIQDVAIGEVWLCAGQSNMGWSTANSAEAELEAKVNLPNYRIFKSAREHWHEPLQEKRDLLGQWKPCNPESAAETSVVAYNFGKKLHLALNVPVGIIQQAYAGTPIEGWMPWEVQQDLAQSKEHKTDMDRSAQRQLDGKGESREKSLENFRSELAAYNAKIAAGETMKTQARALQPPSITKPANLGSQYPANIFNGMINPIRPYGIRGAIWYQGERNSKTVPQAVAEATSAGVNASRTTR